MSALSHLWVDGEQIPDDRIEDIFHPPPGVPANFLRSALIVGARGVGKTTLFRYQKRVHSGVAIHISLATEFATLTRQTGFGPLATEVPKDIEPSIVGKASSLLAVSIAQRLAKRGLPLPADGLAQCLPSEFRHGLNPASLEDVSRLKTDLAIAPVRVFERISTDRPLPRFISALGELVEKSHGPLLLLLDRADMVVAPSLTPVIELLDQSTHFIALIAMRPGHAGQTIAEAATNAVAGDTYSVVHLGMLPRSDQWKTLVEAAVSAQLATFRSLPSDIKDAVIAVSRDSLRIALELFARYVSVPVSQAKDELIGAIEDCRENQLLAAQHVLQTYHPNFRALIGKMRTDAAKRDNHSGAPLLLEIESRPVDSLFDTVTRTSKFIDAALRCGAVSMPDGLRWIPGIAPTAVEIPPILIWDKTDGFTTRHRSEAIRLHYNETDVLRPSGGRPKDPSIFVAFRMRIQESIHFRNGIDQALRKHHRLHALQVTDGHVPAGVAWAKIIRGRIKSASVVVGDVSGMSPEVLFELGFSHGLKKIIIPAVADPSQVTALPRWLGETQLAHYASEAGIQGLLASIESHLIDPEFSKPPSPPQPIPSLIVWHRTLPWNLHAFEQVSSSTQKEGLRIETFPDDIAEEIVLRRAGSAALLIVALDGTASDTLLHFMCGAIAAKPVAGYGTLQRLVLIIEEPGNTGRSFVSDGVRRCSDVVRVVPMQRLREEVAAFCKDYLRWSQSPQKPRRRK